MDIKVAAPKWDMGRANGSCPDVRGFIPTGAGPRAMNFQGDASKNRPLRPLPKVPPPKANATPGSPHPRGPSAGSAGGGVSTPLR
eukprot:9263602-Pyramimonas_sp.AAC.1